MPRIQISLEEGFSGEPIIVEVNGRKVYDRRGVRTRTQIGFADSFEVSVDEPDVEVRVRAMARGIAETITLPRDPEVFLGVSMEGDRITHRVSREPFGYM